MSTPRNQTLHSHAPIPSRSGNVITVVRGFGYPSRSTAHVSWSANTSPLLITVCVTSICNYILCVMFTLQKSENYCPAPSLIHSASEHQVRAAMSAVFQAVPDVTYSRNHPAVI